MSYLSPTSASEACRLKTERTAKIIAGCTDYFPSRTAGDLSQTLLDLTRIPEFRGIARTAGGWRIGALTTWTDITSADLPPAFDALKLAAREVGGIQIQNRATLGGNICNASPAADGVPPLLALDAEVEILSATQRRQIGLSEFITGVRSVDLGPDELVSSFFVPAPPEEAHSAFIKLGSRTHLVISIAMVAAVVTIRADRISDARIAVGSCSPVATRLPEFEARLIGKSRSEVVEQGLVEASEMRHLSPISDVRGSADYRRDVVAEMCRRAVLDAFGED